ncbi:RsmB/NOP family class I SAM-dependent RNA methyltransferase [Pelagibacterium lacus]|uniref:RsmB/NOP family class I SAM-dependent RNA methyltransferase n=1 Tax=Pelagibacterium lacus TaxID=2282655 RepID=A0A369W2E6_9HYPH|nr:RsmB/NOP family class I SAM-dependent RNA methyltransferase [Pelagibacterium lacus]RDE08127.1 RsmB/NOP family class I SAM-dependent RNA methyltransferase [Pelagibacterium lacus]
MRLPGRIAAAIEVLADMEARKRPASEALKGWALDHRFAGAGDRAAIGNLVYDALRKRASHAWRMGEDTPRALVLSVVVNDWTQDVKSLNQDFSSDRFAPESISEAEAARLCSDSALSDAPDPVRADVPDWLAPSLARNFGADWVKEGQGMTTRPPLDMRINSLKADRRRVEKSLARFGPAPTAIAPDGLRLAAGPADARTANVQADEGYQKGWFEIQDEGSQIVALLAGAQPGEQVLDLCAGAGGKTLALAAAMHNSGQIFSYDADRTRLAPIHERLKRNGVRNVQVRNPDPGALDGLAGRMDRVVVDAPCTGTGTWRRRPDTKWKLTPAQLEQRIADQRAVLAEAAGYVRPGAEMVYITCSILLEENDDQIEHFLAEHAAFAPVSLTARWAELFPGAAPPLSRNGHSVTLTPATTGTDGFFCAVLRRE